MTQENKTILISGATNGIGRAAAAQLAAMGHTIVIVGRNREKCIAATETICQQTGGRVSWLMADLSSQAQVRRLAEEFRQRFRRLDVLINNAGAVFIRRVETVDGMELCWSVNYLQTFLLTHLLLDLLKASAPARIINLSSVFHWVARLNLDNLHERGRYIGWNVYARCKLASLYFTYELARRLEGSGVTANAIHPGLVKTGMGKTSGWLLRSVFRVVDLFAVTPEEGAEGVSNLAINPALETVSGLYFSGMKTARSSPLSYNRDIARQLWEISAKATGVSGYDLGS
jgi:NAD(P)-dependent dehydrogenase (short-subunit alcohol dehydrogenase family)